MTVSEIKTAITQLAPQEFAELMAWLQEHYQDALEKQQPTLDDVYAILGERYNSGEHDVAARHNEHQP